MGTEDRVDLRFDCGPNGTLKRSEAAALEHLALDSVSGTVGKTATGYLAVPDRLNLLCINFSGTLLARVKNQSEIVIAPPRSITFVRAGTRLVVQAARGEHHALLLSWSSELTPLLEIWTAAQGEGRGGGRQAACKPIDPHFADAIARFEQALEWEGGPLEPLLVSVVYEVVSKLLLGFDEFQLAPTPIDLPDTISELTDRVREKPALGWPLKEAAAAAGYSPFHFSRVFKSMVGYGFHEYVDRCRTECAVQLLSSTDSAVDLVASTCGFGTTQGLRDSIKEYLGLVPSELRAVPDSFDNFS
jgi:AraC-like DNA-binding protein